jgi:hypothetical protein
LTVVDVHIEPSVSKRAISAAAQTDVNYQVTVQDNSTTGDGVTVNSLIDNKFGDITLTHAANASCGAGQASCEEVTVVTTQGSTTHTNHVTVKSTDSDGAVHRCHARRQRHDKRRVLAISRS